MKDDFTKAFFEIADTKLEEASKAQELAEIKNQMIRHQRRMHEFTLWVDPKEIAKRREREREDAKLAEEHARIYREKMGLKDPDPLPDPLPPDLVGQAPSTIRAILRQRRESKST